MRNFIFISQLIYVAIIKCSQSSLLFNIQKTFDDLLVVVSFADIYIEVSSPIHCATLCEESAFCNSFFFHEVEQKCWLCPHRVVDADIKNGEPYPGLRYYSLNDGYTPRPSELIQDPWDEKWPVGTYSFLKTVNGCPETSAVFEWVSGSRELETDHNKANMFARSLNISGYVQDYKGKLEFCTKTTKTRGYEWPAGKYCILKYGNCPNGFTVSSVVIDEKGTADIKSGILPDGSYGIDTKMYFCCRSDGIALNPITLPTSKPLYLFPYETYNECQNVLNMASSHEYIAWNTVNASWSSSTHYPPLTFVTTGFLWQHFCYYTYIGEV